MNTTTTTNTVIFEDAEREITQALLTTGNDFIPADVIASAEVGAISIENVQGLSSAIAQNHTTLHEKEMNQRIFHKKALLLEAKENNDPAYESLIMLHQEEDLMYNELEKRYGKKAAAMEHAVINKLITAFRSAKKTSSCIDKVSAFR